MKRIGVIKEIDRLGRLVIPKAYRDRLGLEKEVELVLTKEGVLVRKPGHNENECGDGVLRNGE